MKKLYLFLLILPLSFLSSVYQDTIDTTTELIKRGQIHELAKTFSSTVELTILDQENTYSSIKAEAALTDFFKTRSPKTATILHRITSNSNYRFAVLVLTTNDVTYRITF